MPSIVVPAFNEEASIGAAVTALLELEGVKVVISDDGSRDKTVAVARGRIGGREDFRVIEGPHQGKGAALTRGLDACKGDVLGFLDADLSAGPEELMRLFAVLDDEDVEMAVGSREMPDSIIPKEQPLLRRLLGSIYSLFTRALFGIEVRDFQCGCKAFRRELWDNVDVRSKGFIFDTELIVKAASKGFTIREVPITWTDHPASKVNSVRDPLLMLAGLIRLKLEMMGWVR